MLIKYYDNKELVYTSRKRYRTFNFEPFAQETQNRVLLGDGAKTSIKTSVTNLCNYVTIDNTRWFVVNHTYLNGGQIRLNLQRDVIGEFGINNCFGKIERGYTNSILKNRKELGLNQILKKRSKLIPETGIYGNYTVDNHNDELWGIMYLTRPSDGQITIPIPGFAPETSDFDFIENGTQKIRSVQSELYFAITIRTSPGLNLFNVYMNFTSNGEYIDLSDIEVVYTENGQYNYQFVFDTQFMGLDIPEQADLIKQIFSVFAELNVFGFDDSAMFVVPSKPSVDTYIPDYDNITILHDNKYYKYTMTEGTKSTFGSKADNSVLTSLLRELIGTYDFLSKTYQLKSISVSDPDHIVFDYSCAWKSNVVTYNYTILSGLDAGELVIDVSGVDLVNEPYYILVFPLYDVNISGVKNYTINSSEAWSIWNNVILSLSGDNGYLVDAQIYPYCPVLTSVNAEINGYPFFNINGIFA